MNGDPIFDGPPAPAGDAFYDPPGDLSGGDVGDAIYLRELDNPEAALTHGRNWLVLYRSQSVTGDVIAVSGIIALPNEPPRTDDGYPLITWAHGTVGVCHTCAPSRDTVDSGAHWMNKYPQPLLNHFLDQGWAVAMSDYEGLGVTGRQHPYMLGESEAYGVLDIVETTRRLFPGVVSSGKYAIVGHSQGGQAALFSAHYASGVEGAGRVEGLVGVAAIAPANHPKPIVRAGALVPDEANGGFAFTALFLAGAIGGDASIDVGNVLSNKALPRWPHVDQRCRAGLSDEDSWGGLLGTEQFRFNGLLPYPSKPNADQENFETQLEKMNPNLTIGVPIRISQSEDDDRVKAATTEVNIGPINIVVPGVTALVEELEAENPANAPLYALYKIREVIIPDPDPGNLGAHFATMTRDRDDLTGWLIDRFTA